MRADRLIRLIMVLQRHRKVTASRLAELLEVSERTVLRDMEALSAAGVPVFTERGRDGGCRLLDGYTTDASGLTTAEAQALFSWAGRESAAELGMHTDLAGALAKISASAPAATIEQAEALGDIIVSDRAGWFGTAEKVGHLPALREACSQRRRVQLHYRGAGAAATGRRTLDPIGLVDQSGRWYLVAEHRGQLRTFRISRVQGVRILADPSQSRETRPLPLVWRELRGRFEGDRGGGVSVIALVAPDLATTLRRVIGTQLVAGTEITRTLPDIDGREQWSYAVRTRNAAISMALTFAPELFLLGPDDLVADVRRAAAAAHAAYGSVS